MKLINRFKQILKELNNDPLFQLKKIYNRLSFKLIGLLYVQSYYKKRKELNGQDIVIYTLGKSGSSSIYYTLMKRYPFKKFFHVHFLSDYWIREVFPNTPHVRNIHKAEEYFKYKNKHTDRKTKFITLVREPIGRDISGFFQNYRLMNIKIDKENFESILIQIKERGHDLALNWFDTDFKNFTGYDIFDIPFNKELGYQIYIIDDKTELLIIRTDKLSDVFVEAMQKYTSITFDKLYNFNISSSKSDGDLIEQVKSNYYEDNNSLEVVYNSKFMKYFFTDEEIDKYKQKWSKKK